MRRLPRWSAIPIRMGGGNLHNKVVYHAMKALNEPEWGLGWPVLRFNFRGTGLSEGKHDGKAETGDVLAALDWLENEFKLPVVVVGFSFGAAMALQACCGHAAGPARMCARWSRWACRPQPTAAAITIPSCRTAPFPSSS